jgi:hypothetical protein
MSQRHITQPKYGFTPALISLALIATVFSMITAAILTGKPVLILAASLSGALLIRGAMRWLSAQGSRPALDRGDPAHWPDAVSAPLAVAILLRFMAGEPLCALRGEIGCSPERFEMRLRAAIRLLLSSSAHRTPPRPIPEAPPGSTTIPVNAGPADSNTDSIPRAARNGAAFPMPV